VHESTLGVHEVKLVIKARPGFGDGGSVAKHRDAAVDRGKLATRRTDGPIELLVESRASDKNNSLSVVNTELEAGRAPFHKVEGGFGLKSASGNIAVKRNDITTVQEGHSHVFTVARVANHHLVVWLETCAGQYPRKGMLQ
jgi:hypothetical protein